MESQDLPDTQSLYQLGDQAECVVEEVFSFGVFVRLDGHVAGYIRRRELDWASNVDPYEVVRVGQHIEAAVIALPISDRRMELSRKAVLTDPWPPFFRKHKINDVVSGTVVQIRPQSVFAEITPGVNGLIPLEELATWAVERPESVVWEGDEIEAVITKLDLSERLVRLSIRERLKQISRSADIWKQYAALAVRDKSDSVPIYAHQDRTPDLEPPQHNESEESQPAASRTESIGPILVVDNLEDICGSLVRWLEDQGYEAEGASSAAAALERIEKRKFGVLLVDIGLGEDDGLEFLAHIKSSLDAAVVVVMSIPEWLAERSNEIEMLDVTYALPKPLDPDEIAGLFQRIASGEPLKPWKATPADLSPSTETPFESFMTSIPEAAPLFDRLQVGLNHLLESIGADVGILFRKDTASRAISVLSWAGIDVIENSAVYALSDSPVKNVLMEGRPIFETKVLSRADKRFAKLLELLPFGSCIGVPIEIQGDIRHALFLFASEQEAFHRYRLRDVLAMADRLAATLERDLLVQHGQKLNTLLLSGQMAAGLGHEVYNKLSGVEIQLRNLRGDWSRLEQKTPKLATSREYQTMKESLEGVVDLAEDLRATIRLFQQMAQLDRENTVAIKRVLAGAKVLTEPMAQRERIQIEIVEGPPLPRVTGSRIALQQVFLNIMLNAVQQIGSIRRKTGRLEVSISLEPDNQSRPIKVRFTDNGPGIHKQAWESVFSLGYTTRKDGSGLGLFIARNLVESMGGRICVERSIMPLGATFLVELPAAMEGEYA